METSENCQLKTLINELTQGMELAKQLKVHLSSASSMETRKLLVQQILSSYEKALLILNWSGSVEVQPQPAGQIATIVPVSPVSVDVSPRSDVIDRKFNDYQDHNDASKKRKMMPRWTDQVRVGSENWLEGPHDDGYNWRKYGQKDILGAKYPRSYYRCTYRNVRDCWATKQVQRSDEDPSIFEITYRGRHTCTQANNSIPAPASPEKQEPKQNNHHHSHNKQNQSNDMLTSFRTGLRVNTEDLDNKDMTSTLSFPSTSFGYMSENHIFTPSMLDNNNLLGSFPQSFLSPAASESNYFSASPCQRNSFGGIHMLQHSESDHTEIISTNTSATNSPILDLDFSLDPAHLDPNFPFDTPGFFT
nr:WRKY [Loropetalum chinense var. rubrum]